jgi:hypothetical protein
MKKTMYSILLLVTSGMLFLSCMDRASQKQPYSSISSSNLSTNMTKDSVIETLIQQLTAKDAATRERAITELTEQGKKALPALTMAINRPDAEAKDLLMLTLARIADTSSTVVFQSGLKDDVAKVRAMAAQGLVKLKHPEAVDALIHTLHDYGNETSPFTTSAYSLIDYGTMALPKVILLLSDSSVYTRKMAYNIVHQIALKIPEHKYKWKELSSELGNYDPTQPPSQQQQSIQKWTQWVASISKK